jgi:hypothetical protein
VLCIHTRRPPDEKCLASWCVFLFYNRGVIASDCTQRVLHNGSCLVEPIVPCAERCGVVLLRSRARYKMRARISAFD